MNTEQTIISIDHKFSEQQKIIVESYRADSTIEITQYVDGKGYNITLTNEQAYKLIDLMKTAMEVKL